MNATDRPSVRQAGEAWALAGLDPDVTASLDAALARCDEIYRECSVACGTADPTPALLARGELDWAPAISADRSRPLTREDKRRVQTLARNAVQVVLADALTAVRARDPHALLASAHDDVIAEATELAPKVDGIGTDAEAMRAPARQRDAFARLAVLAERRRHILDAHSRLAAFGMFRRVAHDAPPLGSRYRHPDLVPNGREFRASAQARQLADLVLSGAEPRIATDAELAEEWPTKAKTKPPSRPDTLRIYGEQPGVPEPTDDGTNSVLNHTLT